MKVTIQVQETRQPYGWLNTFPARVLFANKDLIVVKGCGTHSFYHGDGTVLMGSFNHEHPHAKLVPERYGKWRIHPASMKRLRALNTPSKTRPAASRGIGQGSGSRGSRSPSARSPSVSKTLRSKKARLRSSPRRVS